MKMQNKSKPHFHKQHSGLRCQHDTHKSEFTANSCTAQNNTVAARMVHKPECGSDNPIPNSIMKFHKKTMFGSYRL